MNEMIKELMKQAGTDSSGKWMGVEHAEKFAELIVRECAKFADKGNRGGTGELMKKHFGVEE